ncbi:MAG TPA: ABC transporter permease [Terracidiphilus sp.]|nr:ABC transporter permease [Terracidiphilus sp.]
MSETLRLLKRLWAFIRRKPLDNDLEAELAAHLQMAIDDNIARGLKPIEARRLALISMGGMEQARYRQREARGFMTLDVLKQDLKYTLRTLWRDPSFTIVAALILALAIGANIAVFSVVNTLLLRPLPFPNAHELVWIAPPPAKCGLSCATYSTDAYDEFRTGSRSYQDVTGYFAFSGPDNLSLNLGGAPIPATSIDVIQNFFQLLGVHAQMGRVFRPEDARNGAAPVILLSNAWWKRQFNSDPNIVGKAFDMNGQQTTVIGVLPESFDFGAVFAPGTKVDAITPLNLYGPPRDWGNIITMIGRMKPGVTLGQAVDEAARVAPHMCWNNKQPRSCGDYKDGVVPVPLKDYISGKLRRSLVVLWSAVGAILLIACVNLSNLLLARAAARAKEFAMRGALGASRGRIVRQLLTESLVLSGLGAIFGFMLAVILVQWLAHQGAIALPLLSTLHMDSAAVGWTALIAIFSATLFGLVPGLRMAGGNVYESLKDAGPGATASRKHERTRSVLVVSEVALACMLLVGAGLLLRSFINVLNVDLGFEPDHAAAIKVDYNDTVPNDKNGDLAAQKRGVIFQQILSRVGALPGVEAAGMVDYLPLRQNRAWGLPFPKGVKRPEKIDSGPLVYVISPGYMRAMGTPIRGRDFTWSDGPKSEPVVLINKSFAKFLAGFAKWPNGDAVGQSLSNGSDADLHVVGIVDDVHEENVDGDTGWQIYYPMTQAGPNGAELVVRTRMNPASLAGPVLAALREMNPKQPAAEFKPIRLLVNHAVSGRQFFMLLVVAFAVLGLLLAALGIYGVISYTVTRQTQEIGIRMALGASAGKVRQRVLLSTMRLALIGVAIGLCASLECARMMAALLFNTSPWDIVTYGSMALLLLVIAAFSGYVPAFRASRINPIVALRTN